MKRNLLFILCLAFVLISCANTSNKINSATQSAQMEEDEMDEDDSSEDVDKYANIDLPPLHAACNHDVIDKDLVRKLVAEGYDINEYAIDSMTPLRLACNRSHIDKEAIKLLVELGAHTGTIEINRYSYAYSPLKHACDRSDIDADALRLLFELGAKPESWIEERDGTALMAACNRSKIDLEAVKVLIDHGASLKATDNRDRSLAMMALDHKHYSKDAIKLLLDSGLDVNRGNGPTQNKLITMVVHDLELTKKVIESSLERSQTKSTKPFSEDAMQFVETTMRNSPEYDEAMIARVKEKMAQAGKTPSSEQNPLLSVDEEGTGVLSYAAAWGNKDVVRYLLDHGLSEDINKPNEKGLTPLFFAAYSGNLEVVKMLVDAGADIRAKDNANRNVLAAACRGEHNSVIFRYTKTEGYLHYASDLLEKKAPEPEMIRYFLDAGVPAGEANNNGVTPLHLAAYNELTQPEVLKMLIKAGADPNAATASGRTPLMYAASVESDEFLIKNGADIKAADKNGLTVLHHAIKDRHADIAGV
ncbi:MAG: ankyrin repeat domain-containing protein, partial [Proteobacteria bacterium]|nr:ankyrin repeat domain-containing protein [Pseudomonadota bacterium]